MRHTYLSQFKPFVCCYYYDQAHRYKFRGRPMAYKNSCHPAWLISIGALFKLSAKLLPDLSKGRKWVWKKAKQISVFCTFGGGSNKPTGPPIPRSLQCAYLMPFQVTFADAAFIRRRTLGGKTARRCCRPGRHSTSGGNMNIFNAKIRLSAAKKL